MKAFEEKPLEPKSTLVSTGCYIFPQKNLADVIIFAEKKNDDLGGIFEYFLEKKMVVNFFPFHEDWYDIGSFSVYIDAHKKIQKEGKLVEDSAIIDKKSQLIGAVYIGEDCRVKNSVIENSIIMAGCKISDCVIRDCIIDVKGRLTGVDLNRKMIREGIEIGG